MSVKDRVAIVTGGGLGLGRLYALALSQRGAKVVVNDYGGSLDGKPGSANRAQCVVDEIKAAGGIAVADHHDVSDKVGAKAIVETAVKAFGSVHILINNAGITGKVSPHDDVDGAAFMRVMEISALGTTLVTSAAYGIMAKQKFGRIINISSNAIYGFGAGGDCAYGASKGATFAITRELGRWSERDGIKINAILPSAASRMTELSEGTKKLAETYFPAKVCMSLEPRRARYAVEILTSNRESFHSSSSSARTNARSLEKPSLPAPTEPRGRQSPRFLEPCRKLQKGF